MIIVESLTIQSFRGIQNLTLSPGGRNFAVCGPNGTGKSGVVDAIEFAITGSVTRLTGQGTAGISLKAHGPHVDKRDNPADARVILRARIPGKEKTFTIERRVDTPNDPIVNPADGYVLEIVSELARHPEFALSRREIIKYVIAAPGDRSKEVQALLRLDYVEKVRANLQTLFNSTKTRLRAAENAEKEAVSQLLKALGIPALKRDAVVNAANSRRAILGLEPLTELGPDTSLKAGIGTANAPSSKQKVSKTQATADLNELADRLTASEPTAAVESRAAVKAALEKLVAAPALLRSLRREDFLRSGLQLFDEEEECPFCEQDWDLIALRARIEERLAQAKEASETKAQLTNAAQPLIAAIRELETLAATVAKHAQQLPSQVNATALLEWAAGLKAQRERMLSLDAINDNIAVLQHDFRQASERVMQNIAEIRAGVQVLPDPSKEDEAREYLTLCQERLEVYREMRRQALRGKEQNALAQKVLDAYSTSSTAVLAKIYSDVEKDFTDYYRIVNRDDEAAFEGKLTPSLGKLGFDVDFYGRGLFPPGAYHSEGHQDGMGLCLYLALMKHTLGQNFTFAVLDDVLMSIDSGHRREICGLLKGKFSQTQFLITTHDPIWLQHMSSEKMIDSKSSVQFRKWTVDDGPLVWEGGQVWDEINRDLQNDDVSGASGTLRRYLEFLSGHLAHKLRASTEYRADANHDLGDLLPAVTSAWTKLLGNAQKAANSWNKKEESAKLSVRQADFKAKLEKSNVEKWAINKTVHYNEWVQLHKSEFVPVVESFKELLACFRCESCGSFAYVSPMKGSKENIRCDCGDLNINLKEK